MNIRQTENKIAALYERLFRDDDLAGDSNSIIRDYLQTGFYTEALFRQYDSTSSPSETMPAATTRTATSLRRF